MLNFARLSTDFVWTTLAEIRRIEDEKITRLTAGFAQFAEDYWQSKLKESDIRKERYLPFLQQQPKSPYSPEVRESISYCLRNNLIPAKFLRLVAEC